MPLNEKHKSWLKRVLGIDTDNPEMLEDTVLEGQLTAKLKELEAKVQKELKDADANHRVAMMTPIEQAREALAKHDYDKVESALEDLDKVLKGGTGATPPQAASQLVAQADEADAKAFKKLRTSAEAKLKQNSKADGVQPQLRGFLKALKDADQAAADQDWGAALSMITDLDTQLDGLPALIAEQRDAENDCREQLKHLTQRLNDYKKLEKEKQDTKVLGNAAEGLKIIQKKMDDKRYAAALKDIEQQIRDLSVANVAANWGDGGLKGNSLKGREGKMMKEAAARQEMIAVKELDARVQAETIGEALGLPEIRALMNEHRNLIAPEVKAFKGYRWMDDVQDAIDAARSKRDDKAVAAITKNVKVMCDAIDAAKNRQLRMFSLLRGVKETADNADNLKNAREFARGMTNHIPDIWLTEGPMLAKRLPTMVKSKEERAKELEEAKEIPDETRNEENKLFKDAIEHGSLKGADRTQFYFDEPLRAIPRDTMDERALAKAGEAASLLAEYKTLDEDNRDDEFANEMKAMIESATKMAKSAQANLKKQRTDNSPDPSIAKELMQSTQASEEAIRLLREQFTKAGKKPETKDAGSQYERLMKTYDAMIQRAYKIRDAGGSVQDVEDSMKHVPPEFWPAQFIENLQAWRKVERELGEERVQELFAKTKFSFGDAAECLSFAKEIYGNLGLSSGMHGAVTGANDTAGWMNVPSVASLIEGYISEVQDGFGLGKDAAEALETLDYSGLKAERLSDLYDNAANATKTLIGAVTNIKNVPGIPPAGVFASEVVPILSAIAAGIDLSISLNALRKAITMRVKTGSMIKDAELEYFSGEMRDGGAMVRAIKNERDARNRQVAKKGTDVASKSVVVAGEATKAAVGSGWGTEQAVGHGLVIAGKAIEYGGKIVFAGIDWGIAEQAKKLIKEAQAGNPIARMEIMENSGLYAKMYIAILAKSGNKLALKFIDQRGYDERSVMKPTVSLQILREAMLSHADQKDETQVSDSLALELTESITGKGVTKAVKTAGKGAQALAKKIKDLPKDKSIEYDPSWTPKSAGSSLADEWSANKKDCIAKAGLYEESTGIAKAIKPVDEAVKAATTALDNYRKAKGITSEDRAKVIAQVRKSQAVIGKAMDVIADYYPGTNQGDLHQPMTDYLVSMRRVLGTQSNQLDLGLTDLKLIQADWTPPKKPGNSAAAWAANWADAVNKCDLPKNDAGVGNALQAFEAANAKRLGYSTNQVKEIRDARIEVREALRMAGDAVKKLWPTCTSFSGMTDYLDGLTDFLVKVSQNNDKALNGFDWDQSPFKVSSASGLFTSATWIATYNAADKMGFVNRSKGQCGMDKALQNWEKNVLSKSPEEVKKLVASKDLVKKRKEATKVVAEVARSAEQLAAANPDAHSDFLKYVAYLRREAHVRVAQFGEEQDKTDFSITKRLDAASWKLTYENGVGAGAIPENKKAFSELNKSISDFTQAYSSIKSAKKPKDKFAAAKDAEAKSANLQKTLSNITGTEGWTNDRLLEFLDFVRDEAQAEVEVGLIAQVINGSKAEFAKPEDFEFKNKGGWQNVKKKAVEAGVMADSKSGLGKTIDQYLSAVKKRDSAEKKKAKKPDVYRTAIEIVISRLDTIEGAARQLATQTENAVLKAYLDSSNKGSVGAVCRTEKRAQQKILDGLPK